ncbi:MAG: adenylate/guanylate cyclase domain-containing protein, partial [Flavobacteriaceae bacterium]
MSEEEIDRKITVIFATDVVGYSKHMEADESGTVKNLRACEKILTGLFEKHKGRLFNTGGDSFLAEFPSAVSAVECAVEFQKAIKERNSSEEASVKLQFRIGINSGDVIKEKDNLLGDGVNIAARLEALAQSGGITISKVIYDFVKGKTQYEFNDLGLQKVKLNEFHAFDLLIDGNEKRKLKSDTKNKIGIFVTVLVIFLFAAAFSFFLNEKQEEDKNLTIAKNDTNKPIILVIPIQTLGLAQEGLDKAITESLISNISRYNGVKTLSSGISYEVQRRQYNREDLKNKLGVTHLVKGSLQSVGQNNRLSLELTKINEETIIWSKQLEFELNQLFEIQDAASLELLNSIQVNAVTGDVAAQTEKDFTTFEQFKLALNRRGEWRKWTSDGYAKSVQITSQLEDLGVDQYVILNLKAWNLHQKLLLRLS